MEFDISPSLKNHYLFEDPIRELLDCFVMVFKAEKKELLRKFESGHDADKLGFSTTMYSLNDMIVYRYFNDELSFVERAFITSRKFSEYPFSKKIKELKLNKNPLKG